MLALGMSIFSDRGFYKRAQIAPRPGLAGVAQFTDLDRLTIFADNLVPHVLRRDGVLVYDGPLAHTSTPAPAARQAREERESARPRSTPCELLAPRLGVAPRALDTWLWDRGQGAAYKPRPRHRCRCVSY